DGHGDPRALPSFPTRRSSDLTRVLDGPPNAETALEVRAAGEGLLQVRLHPRTGRTHQLRAQLAARGAPILGEDLYRPAQDPPPPADAGGPDLPLQLLSRTLRFADPHTGVRREFTSAQELAGRSRTLGR